MSKFRFKDGTVVTANSKEDAIKQYKIIASVDFSYEDKQQIEEFFKPLKRCSRKIGRKISICKGKDINIKIIRVNKHPKLGSADYAEVDVSGKIGDSDISIKKELLSSAIRQLNEEIRYNKETSDNASKLLKELGFKKMFENEWHFDKFGLRVVQISKNKFDVQLLNPLFDSSDIIHTTKSGIISAISKLAKKLLSRSKANVKMAEELNEIVS